MHSMLIRAYAWLIVAMTRSHRLRFNDWQAATLSARALELAAQLRYTTLPWLPVPDCVIEELKRMFAHLTAFDMNAAKLRFAFELSHQAYGGTNTICITPQSLKPEFLDKRMVYIHGGGMMGGDVADNLALGMATEMGIKTLCLEYSTAPEAKYPVAIEECLQAYQAIEQEFGAVNLVGVGSSAGGMLMLAIMLRAHALTWPLPKALGLFTPGADYTPEGDSPTANQGRDVLHYSKAAKKMMAKPYLGDIDPKDPGASPARAPIPQGFAPSVVVAGTRDALLSCTLRVFWKLREAGVPSELLVGDGMWHGYTDDPDMPEAIQSRREVIRFLRSHLLNEKGTHP